MSLLKPNLLVSKLIMNCSSVSFLCIYIYLSLKVIGCSTISIFWQQAAFVSNVQIIIIIIIICTFQKKADFCRNIEIVLHPTTLSYI